jgi:hypothetical protein
MAKHENTPLPYEPRVRDTKGIAQRLDLNYLERPNLFRDLRRKLTWIVPAAAAALSIPFLIGVGGSEKVFSNGPISRPHAMFEKRCVVCHVQAFSSVPKQACLACHDAPSHPAKPIDTAKLISEPVCTTCHVEHRGGDLSGVSDKNCTSCHAALGSRGVGVQLKAAAITAFRPGRHPDFPDPARTDIRPLRLNHAIHMPLAAKTIRGIKLPMKCGDCHATALASPRGDIEPVTFERNCQNCHKRELEFLLPGLPVNAPPAPHTKDPQKIRQFILETYQRLVAENPSLLSSFLDRDMMAERNPALWIAKAARKSEQYLFEKKCVYCHEYQGMNGEFPVIRKVNQIRGRYVEGRADGEPWLMRAEFSHRSHRAVECVSCHTMARASSKTSDVLIPSMKNCAACHGASGTSNDRCNECHLYHNKFNERDRDRRPIEQLTGRLQPEILHVR